MNGGMRHRLEPMMIAGGRVQRNLSLLAGAAPLYRASPRRSVRKRFRVESHGPELKNTCLKYSESGSELGSCAADAP